MSMPQRTSKAHLQLTSSEFRQLVVRSQDRREYPRREIRRGYSRDAGGQLVEEGEGGADREAEGKGSNINVN